MTSMISVLVIGIGNEFRCDDGAGLRVVRELAARNLPGVVVWEGQGLVGDWQGFARVYLVDAVSSGAPPGTVHRLDGHRDRIEPEMFRTSTHALGVAEVVELARQIGGLPEVLVIYGIEGKNFSAGNYLTPEVARAVRELTNTLVREISSEPLPP